MLFYCIFDKNCIDHKFPNEVKVEEFGISARATFNPYVLIKKIASEGDHSDTTEIYLCYNWKSATPFVLKQSRVALKSRGYTPQYGRDDNYPESVTWSVNYQFYSQSEFCIRQPQIAELIGQWIP